MAETCPDCGGKMIADESPNPADDVTWLNCPDCARAAQMETSSGQLIEEWKAIQFPLVLSDVQRADLKTLAGELSAGAYIRRLIAADARERGLTWHSHIPEVGALGGGRRKKNGSAVYGDQSDALKQERTS